MSVGVGLPLRLSAAEKSAKLSVRGHFCHTNLGFGTSQPGLHRLGWRSSCGCGMTSTWSLAFFSLRTGISGCSEAVVDFGGQTHSPKSRARVDSDEKCFLYVFL